LAASSPAFYAFIRKLGGGEYAGAVSNVDGHSTSRDDREPALSQT
jgi:hypothetical protein